MYIIIVYVVFDFILPYAGFDLRLTWLRIWCFMVGYFELLIACFVLDGFVLCVCLLYAWWVVIWTIWFDWLLMFVLLCCFICLTLNCCLINMDFVLVDCATLVCVVSLVFTLMFVIWLTFWVLCCLMIDYFVLIVCWLVGCFIWF